MKCRKGTTADMPALLECWRRSVMATHHFLTDDDLREIAREVRTAALPVLDIWLCEDAAGVPVAFMGLNGPRVEALFVAPAHFRRGLGTALLDHARRLHGHLSLDVNAQNPQAHAFYLRYGFRETGRSPVDGAGRPFPLIHMAL